MESDLDDDLDEGEWRLPLEILTGRHVFPGELSWLQDPAALFPPLITRSTK